jgi:Flp pilus assembly protein TadD
MPTSDELYSEADKLKDSGDLQGAAKKLDELLAQDPRFALAHSALAILCGRLGRHEEAVAHAVKVCELEPNDPFSFTALSVTCQRAGRIMEAEEAMARARMMQGR